MHFRTVHASRASRTVLAQLRSIFEESRVAAEAQTKQQLVEEAFFLESSLDQRSGGSGVKWGGGGSRIFPFDAPFCLHKVGRLPLNVQLCALGVRGNHYGTSMAPSVVCGLTCPPPPPPFFSGPFADATGSEAGRREGVALTLATNTTFSACEGSVFPHTSEDGSPRVWRALRDGRVFIRPGLH